MNLIKPTIVCLRISSIIYILLGLVMIPFGFFAFSVDFFSGFILLLFCPFSIGIGVFIEIVIAGLKKKKKWTWMAALILCIMYIPSAFVILGVIGIIPLFKDEVKKDFNW